jgi:predicted  nucleic acid-binding Zn-ribbon protein
METIHTTEAKALAELQKNDSAIDALSASIATVPGAIAAAEAGFAKKRALLGAAREAFYALQLKKKEAELRLAEAEEGIRKHQRELNLVKENDAFKALLSEIENDKKIKDEMETAELVLLEELDRASSADKEAQSVLKAAETAKNAEVAALEASARELTSRLEAARAQRASAASAIDAGLLEKYEAIRSGRGGLAVVAVHEEPGTGKLSCGGCHMALTPQKAVDVKKHDSFTICADCRRLMYLERTIYG